MHPEKKAARNAKLVIDKSSPMFSLSTQARVDTSAGGYLQRALYLIAALILLPVVVGPLMLAFDLAAFELRPLGALIGWSGGLVFGFLWAGALWLLIRMIRAIV